MKIAIASGKGGTGKTTVATNLAVVLNDRGDRAQYIDCDVEEPNGHLFLNPEISSREQFGVDVPKVSDDKCIYCGKCGDICQFNAILPLKDKVLTFPDLCHNCGGCLLVCPTEAITWEKRIIGIIEIGDADGVRFVHGKLNVGEIRTPPLIREVKSRGEDLVAGYENHSDSEREGFEHRGRPDPEPVTIIDCPPGTSCPVIEAIKEADFVLLVTEPTPFGFNDLKLALEVVKILKIPFGIALNRSDLGTNEVAEYCVRNHIPALLQLPDDRRIAAAYSTGKIAVVELPEYKPKFDALFELIVREIAQ